MQEQIACSRLRELRPQSGNRNRVLPRLAGGGGRRDNRFKEAVTGGGGGGGRGRTGDAFCFGPARRKSRKKGARGSGKRREKFRGFIGWCGTGANTGAFGQITGARLCVCSRKAEISGLAVLVRLAGCFLGGVTGPGELVGAPRNADATAAQAPIPPGSWPNGLGRVRAGLTPSGRDAPAGESGDQQHPREKDEQRQSLPLPDDNLDRGRSRARPGRSGSFLAGGRSVTRPLPSSVHFLENPSNAILLTSWHYSRLCNCYGKPAKVGGEGTSIGQGHGVFVTRRQTTATRARSRRVTWTLWRNLRCQIPQNRKDINDAQAGVVRNDVAEEEDEELWEGSSLRGSDAGLPAARRTRTQVFAGAASSVVILRTPTTSTRYRRDRALCHVVELRHEDPNELSGAKRKDGLASCAIASLVRSNRNPEKVETGRERTRWKKRRKRWSTLVPKERRQERGDASVPIKKKPMQLKKVRFTGPSSKTRLSTKNNSKCPLWRRSWLQYLSSSRPAKARQSPSFTPAHHNTHPRETSIESVEDSSKISIGQDASSARPPISNLRSSTDASGHGDTDALWIDRHRNGDVGYDRYATKLGTSDGLARSTAFRVKPCAHHHADESAWIHSMVDERRREASTEKVAHESVPVHESTGLTKDNRQNVEIGHLPGLRFRGNKKYLLPINPVEFKETRSYKKCIRTREYRRLLPRNVLDNTAFNEYYEDEDDYGGNGDDHDYYDDDYNDISNDNSSNVHYVIRTTTKKPESEKAWQLSVAAPCRSDNTKHRRYPWESYAHDRSHKIAHQDNILDDPNYRTVLEAKACENVPGGKLFVTVPGRSYPGCRSTIFAPEQRDHNSVIPDEDATNSDGQALERPRECEKWKNPRRRRRKPVRVKSVDDSCGPGAMLVDERHGEFSKIEEVENDYTARSGEPIAETRSKWCSSISKNMAETQEEGWWGDRGKRRHDGDAKNKEACGGRKFGARSYYGLLFLLYLFALPILCSTDHSSPVALAQKSPLTHSDNFTSRNTSMQPHQMGRNDVLGLDMPHPYNEYTWEVNQVNPWLSACDLAGPAPADLQGSCGPPEVPKNCPHQCVTKTQGDRSFHEVIERLGIKERAKSGAGGSRWRPAGTTNAIKNMNDKGKNGIMRAEDAVAAPEQCLFYLEESHKRDICRDNFGRGSTLSFSNPRENRYWFVSGLRLRHCCEHAVVNALAPGKGGPLEDVLNGGRKCVEALDKILIVDALAARLHCEFEEVLARYDCGQAYSVIHNCTHCKVNFFLPFFRNYIPVADRTVNDFWEFF